MIYGYACIDTNEDEKVLDKKLRVLRKYAKYWNMDMKEITESVNTSTAKQYRDDYNPKFKAILAKAVEGDTIILTTTDDIFPIDSVVIGTLAQFYDHRVSVRVLDFPILATINPNRIMLQRGGYSLYHAILEPLILCRNYYLQQRV